MWFGDCFRRIESFCLQTVVAQSISRWRTSRHFGVNTIWIWHANNTQMALNLPQSQNANQNDSWEYLITETVLTYKGIFSNFDISCRKCCLISLSLTVIPHTGQVSADDGGSLRFPANHQQPSQKQAKRGKIHKKRTHFLSDPPPLDVTSRRKLLMTVTPRQKNDVLSSICPSFWSCPRERETVFPRQESISTADRLQFVRCQDRALIVTLSISLPINSLSSDLRYVWRSCGGVTKYRRWPYFRKATPDSE